MVEIPQLHKSMVEEARGTQNVVVGRNMYIYEGVGWKNKEILRKG
jgi:hypothetical protein